MPTLHRFLDLSPADARAQWHRIAARSYPAPGKRQENYQAVEVVMCFALFFELDPHRYGGANIDSAPPALHALARTFRRSPNSLTIKMLNLEGFRTNSASDEPLLYLRLMEDPALFMELYGVVLSAARDVGLGPHAVPDVLDLETAGGLTFVGDRSLGSASLDDVRRRAREQAQAEAERAQRAANEKRVFTDRDLEVTERLVVVSARLGQHRFARGVLDAWDWSCGFCGLSVTPELRGRRLLIASHVKPWRDADDDERIDRTNGIAACPAHDAAFDTGLLTVDDDGTIVRSHLLAQWPEPLDRGLYRPPLLHHTLRPPTADAAPAPAYLAWHREHVFVRAA